MHNVEAEFSKLQKLQEKVLEEKTGNTVDDMIVSLRSVTPVDTGFARSSWSSEKVSPDTRLVINTADYIEYLNQGSSKQAPARFVEAVALAYGKPQGTIVDVIQK
jgi:hypothetical protein